MPYRFDTLEEFEDSFAFMHGDKPRGLRLFVLGDSENKRLEACQVVKRVIEGILDSAKQSKLIKGYDVMPVDLLDVGSLPARSASYLVCTIGSRLDTGHLIVPIFRNIQNNLGLPQIVFDMGLPAVFSVNQEEYWNVRNPSKRDCYDVLMVEDVGGSE